jgi:1-acyl-sn-glycerol-3-phosphate acyltransferase
VIQPIDNHEYFVKMGKRLRRLFSPLANFELQESIELPEDRPIIMAANHVSFLDFVGAMAIFEKLDRSSRILIRADLFESKFMGNFCRKIEAIPTSTASREAAEATAIETLNKGMIVAMMPEGRLTKPSERVNGVGPAKTGISRIALATGAVLVPVAMVNTEKVWPRGKPPRPHIPRPLVKVKVGSAVEFPSKTDHQENADFSMSVIADLLNEG